MFRLSDPARIVIDLCKTLLNPSIWMFLKDECIPKQDRQFEATTARIVLDIAEDHDFEAVKNATGLRLK